MKINPITSPDNQLLKKIRALGQRSGRQRSGLFLLEGAKLVNEAFAKDLPVRDVLVSQTFLKSGLGACQGTNITAVSVVDDKLFKEVSGTETPEGILAVGEIPRHNLNEIVSGKAPLVLLAVAIQDPGNLGTMIRTAHASGASGVVLSKGCVDPYNAKVVRAAAGALFSLPLVADLSAEEAIKSLKDKGIKVVACDPAAPDPYWGLDMTGPLAIAVGNEGQGFSEAVLALADSKTQVPMQDGCESLNAAITAAIVLFSARQQRSTELNRKSAVECG